MKVFRLYTGDDGQLHLEELAIPFGLEGVCERASLQPTTGIAEGAYALLLASSDTPHEICGDSWHH